MSGAAVARATFWTVFALVTAMTLTWLVVGALVSTPLNEAPGQAVVDYLASAVNLAVAVVLLRFGGASWPTRLLALAMVGSAGAFNLQAHVVTLAVRDALGVEIGELHQVLLHGIAGAAYAGALLLVTGSSSRRLRVLAPVVAAVLFVAGFGTALLPHTVSCVVFFGFGIPLLGVVAVGPAVRRGPTPEARARARLLTSVLVAALGALLVLALLTLVLALLGGRDSPSTTPPPATAARAPGCPSRCCSGSRGSPPPSSRSRCSPPDGPARPSAACTGASPPCSPSSRSAASRCCSRRSSAPCWVRSGGGRWPSSRSPRCGCRSRAPPTGSPSASSTAPAPPRPPCSPGSRPSPRGRRGATPTSTGCPRPSGTPSARGPCGSPCTARACATASSFTTRP